VDALYVDASARQTAEIGKLKAIAEGKNDRSWVLEKLKALNCKLPE